MAAIPSLPPLNIASQASSNAHGASSAGFDNSGFVVNFGGGNSVGAAIPQWAVMAALIGGVVWLIKRKRG